MHVMMQISHVPCRYRIRETANAIAIYVSKVIYTDIITYMWTTTLIEFDARARWYTCIPIPIWSSTHVRLCSTVGVRE